MSLEIMRDPRVRGVEWRDLVALSRWEIVRELCLPVPWLGASLLLAGLAWSWPVLVLPALGCSFVFFLTGLRVVHNAHHYALGLPRCVPALAPGALADSTLLCHPSPQSLL